MVASRAASKHQSFVGFFVFISSFLLADSHEQALKEVLSGVSVLGLYGFMYVRSVLEGVIFGDQVVSWVHVRPELPFSIEEIPSWKYWLLFALILAGPAGSLGLAEQKPKPFGSGESGPDQVKRSSFHRGRHVGYYCFY
ncbi:hypothetical protein E2C01_015899 [Portunus trituberculatus]|uniref:Uncharacterized protein n=1 Tax=Portunus trituberculatus TaxID=210409 RepID=A0A5B7DMQ2_PORTR|nr:hypothetical protein [Portunus trituberculatus]